MASVLGKFNQKQERPQAKTAPLTATVSQPPQPIPHPQNDLSEVTLRDIFRAQIAQHKVLVEISAKMDQQTALLGDAKKLLELISMIDQSIDTKLKR